MKYIYDVIVRVGKNAGPIEPEDGKPITSLGAAIQFAEDFKAQAHEIIIIEKRVVKKIPGLLEERGFRKV